jgi:hypothetical protein
MNIVPLEESALEELSSFLVKGFQISPADTHMVSPQVLRWKHLQPRHKWSGPRSFIARDRGGIVAHIAVTPTELLYPGRRNDPIAANYPIEWLADHSAPMMGTMMMLHVFGLPGVQYSFGSTAVGRPVLLRLGFRAVNESGVYYQVTSWHKPVVWSFLHGTPKAPKRAAMLAVDLPRAIVRPRPGARVQNLTLRRVQQFQYDPAEEKQVRDSNVIFSSRAPGLLNYLLSFPGPHMTGWQIEVDGVPVGHGLLNIVERGGVRRGLVVDCFLYSRERELWTGALWALSRQLRAEGCDLVRCCGAAPWLCTALRRNGFFRRGRQPLFIRDALKQLPGEGEFYMTDIEGEGGF